LAFSYYRIPYQALNNAGNLLTLHRNIS